MDREPIELSDDDELRGISRAYRLLGVAYLAGLVAGVVAVALDPARAPAVCVGMAVFVLAQVPNERRLDRRFKAIMDRTMARIMDDAHSPEEETP